MCIIFIKLQRDERLKQGTYSCTSTYVHVVLYVYTRTSTGTQYVCMYIYMNVYIHVCEFMYCTHEASHVLVPVVRVYV